MNSKSKGPKHYVSAIRNSKLSLYDPVDIGDPKLWIPTPELEELLKDGLVGISLAGLPLRTRSKVVKEHVCQILGYPVPSSFKRTRPRFPGQLFDTYTQKSNNLQIWNEELAPTRRYVLIRVNEKGVIEKVRVVTGQELAILDTTGTLTQKYQARLIPGNIKLELVSREDTNLLLPFVRASDDLTIAASSVDDPTEGRLLPIGDIFDRLSKLVVKSFTDTGYDQERNRGAKLHQLVCEYLGYKDYRDDGRFPDVRNQLLEVKLQTSPTIDLGLVCPDSTEVLDVPKIRGQQIRHCDVRYALFFAKTDGKAVTLTHFFLTTGKDFFDRFPKFQGKVLNKKLQIPLPNDFFDK